MVMPYVMATQQKLCQDTVQINTNCTMVTPSLSCSAYNYSIYNVTGGNLVESGDLSFINYSNYYFNFTLSEGKYIITLCDGTTRMVQVTNEGDNTVLGIIILSPLLLAFLFMFIAHSLSADHSVLKISMMFVALVSVFTGWQFSMIVLVDFFGQTQLTDAVATASYLYSWIFYIIITYFVIYLIKVVAEAIGKKNKEKFAY